MPVIPRSGRLYLVYAAVGLIDLARVLWPLEAQPADEIALSWFYRRALVVGLAHTETAQSYQVEKYMTYRGIRVGEPEQIDPFVLVPLNVPDRSEGRLVLLELPLDGRPPIADVNGVEFSGLLGPVPDDLLPFITMAKGQPRPMRLQPAETPSVAISLLLFAGVAWALRMLRKAERSGLRSTGMSRLCFVLAQVPMWLALATRLRLHPAANQGGTWAVVVFTHVIFFAFSLMLMRIRRADEEASPPLSDEAFAAASAAHEEMLTRRRPGS